MLYIKTDGAKKFFKCAEYKDGCQVRVSLAWETDMIVRHNGLTHCHDNKLLEHEVQEMVKVKVKEAANTMTVAPTLSTRSCPPRCWPYMATSLL